MIYLYQSLPDPFGSVGRAGRPEDRTQNAQVVMASDVSSVFQQDGCFSASETRV